MSTRDLRDKAEAANGVDQWWPSSSAGVRADPEGRVFIAAASPRRVLALLDVLAAVEASCAQIDDAIKVGEGLSVYANLRLVGTAMADALDDIRRALRALVGDETPGTGERA